VLFEGVAEQVPSQFEGVSIVCKANVYFDGKVVSHTILFPDGTKKSTGLIYAGTYTFNTGAAERMNIIAGTCTAKIAGEAEAKIYPTGTYFDVPANSSFDISVDSGIAEYVCSFIAAL
jgi:uncharacterized protein YaiE (UPF0345 family)